LRFMVSSIHFSCCLIASLFSTIMPTTAMSPAFYLLYERSTTFRLIHFPLPAPGGRQDSSPPEVCFSLNSGGIFEIKKANGL
jgi:hypothetical protein